MIRKGQLDSDNCRALCITESSQSDSCIRVPSLRQNLLISKKGNHDIQANARTFFSTLLARCCFRLAKPHCNSKSGENKDKPARCRNLIHGIGGNRTTTVDQLTVCRLRQCAGDWIRYLNRPSGWTATVDQSTVRRLSQCTGNWVDRRRHNIIKKAVPRTISKVGIGASYRHRPG